MAAQSVLLQISIKGIHCCTVKSARADSHNMSSSIVAPHCIKLKPTTMARGNGRRMRDQQNPPLPSTTTDKAYELDKLDCKVWPHMPPGVKSFLLERRESPHHPPGHVELPELVSFWASPTIIWFTQGSREDVIQRSRLLLYLATKYLEIGMVAAARTIILTAAFLDECYVSTFIAVYALL